MTAEPFLDRLARAARFERDERTRLYPGLIDAGKIARHSAEDDQRAWRAIADFLGNGAFHWGPAATPGKAPPQLPARIWTPLRDSAAEALSRRETACRRSPGDGALAAHLDNVREIHALFDRLVEAFERRRPEELAA